MTSRIKFRNYVAGALIVLSALPLSAGGKKRSVQKPPETGIIMPPAPPAEAALIGTAVDAVSGLPVINADVFATNVTRYYSRTDSNGSFTMKLPAGVPFTVTISRFGYAPINITVIVPSSGMAQRFVMDSRPTVQIRTTNGTLYQVASETVEFGYLVPLSGFNKERLLSMCADNGSPFTPDRNDLKRIVGPAVAATSKACCDQGQGLVFVLTVELRTGERTHAFFKDSCFGYAIEVIGLDQVKAQLVEIKFSEVAEVVFP